MLTQYLFYNGQCEEALHLYEKAFNSKNTGLMRFKDAPPSEEMGLVDPEMVMHTELPVGESTLFMSDDPMLQTTVGDNISINYSNDDFEEVRRVWNVFVENGSTVTMELEPTFFSPLFGQVTDPYGISWMIMANSHQPE